MRNVSRRDFARLLAVTSSGAWLHAWPKDLDAAPLPQTPAQPDEAFWKQVRTRFLLPADLAFLNAANLCPTSLPAFDALAANTRLLDANPSSSSRATLTEGREKSRRAIATALRVQPEEVLITRNTSEANNLVSSGLALGAGDEVVVFADNHPSNLNAWREKSRRFGFSVVEVPVTTPHPGADALLKAFAAAFTPRTKVLAVTHVTSTMGDLMPVNALCALARERGVLSLVDGAQSFGVLDVNLQTMRPDFYSGSVHKWPCGPKETGVLFVAREVHERLTPSVVSLYGGAVGLSRTHEAFGQRDEAALASVGAALEFQDSIGRAIIEARVRALVKRLADGLSRIDGVSLWTSTDSLRSANILVAKPATIEPRKMVGDLYAQHKIVCAAAGGTTRPGVRFSPHFYNTMDEIDRAVAAVRGYVAQS